jgi:chromosome segregation ATPase
MPKARISSDSVAILLEEIRSQNRATIEAVQAAQQTTDLHFGQLEARLTARIEVLEAVVRSNGTDIKDLKGDVNILKGDVGELKVDVKGLKGDVGELKVDVKDLKGDVRELRTAVTVNSADIRELKAGIAALEGAVRDAASREALERLERRVAALEKHIA